MTRRKPLEWYTTTLGASPDCVPCADRLRSDGFAEAVCSVAVSLRATPGHVMRQAIDQYHASRHQEVAR